MNHNRLKEAQPAHKICRAAGVVLTALFLPSAAQAGYTFVNITDTNYGPFTAGVSDPVINNTGTVAFFGQTGLNANPVMGLYTTSSGGGGPFTTIVDNTGVYTNLSYHPALNDSGTVAFTAKNSITGATGVYTGNGHAVSPLYQSSSTGPFSNILTDINSPAINNGGTVAFQASYNYGYNNIDTHGGVYAGVGGASFNIIKDDSDGTPSEGIPSINNSGVVAVGVGTEIITGIGGNNNVQVLATKGAVYKNFDLAVINSQGTVAFYAQLTAGGYGIFLDHNGMITQAASATPDGGTGLQSLSDPVINASGEVAFDAYTYNSSLGSDVSGIYTGSDPVADKVIAYGDPLFGSTVGGVSSFLGLNDAGQIAFAYTLANGDQGIAVASVASAVANLTWNNAGGASPSDGKTWDIASNNNWNNGSAATVYTDGSNVTFNDGNNNHYAVTLNTTVKPGSVSVNNSTGNYTISGTGSIAGAGSLTKSGAGILTLNTVNTYSGGTTVSAGKLVIGVKGALPDGAVNISGGILQLAANTGLAQITSLSITAGGQFDINNNHVIINYGNGNDPIASIAAWIKSGYAGGAWNGLGIMSSMAQTNSASYGIGYADAADPGNPAGLSSGTIEIKYTLLGDANLDGAVNGSDFAILATNFNKAVSGWDQGDFNYDGAANGADFAFLAANFNKGASQSADSALDSFASANGLLADVPEPAVIACVLPISCYLLQKRRRR